MENIILCLSLILFCVSLGISVFYPSVAALLLNFLTTVIFSWLLSKKSSENQFRCEQQKLAKVSYRHLEDVEKSALRIEQSVKDYVSDSQSGKITVDNETLNYMKSLDGRLDDLKERVTSTNRDWYDWLSDEDKQALDKLKDPEANTIKDLPNSENRIDIGRVSQFIKEEKISSDGKE